MDARRRAGIFGIAGIIILLICAVISAASFEDGAFSPANRFISELGVYIHGYFVISPALLFNIGVIISGLLFCVFAVMHGIQKHTAIDTTAGFFGILAGVLMAAQGLITLNYTKYHLFILAAFFASVFLMCVFTVISQIRSRGSSLAVLIIAFIAGAAAAISSVFILTGGLDKTFGAGASPDARPDVLPCAIIQWGVYALLLVLFFIQSASMFSSGYEDDEYEDDEYMDRDKFEPEPPSRQKRWNNKRDTDF